MRCVRFIPAGERGVTKPELGDDYLGDIDVEAIRAYNVACVPAPANLAQGLPLPVRSVEHVRVKGADGQWRSL